MERIYHFTFATDWRAAVGAGEYVLSARGLTLADEGFIHASYADQVAGVADRFWRDADDVVLLTVAVDRLTPEVRVENGYPHVYGPLNIDAVVAVTPVPTSDDRRLVLPELR